MEHLTTVTIEELHAALASVEGKKSTTRILAAIAYKNDISQSELADWFNVERKTIYNWLTRLDQQDIQTAAKDNERPGRPRKLSAIQIEEIKDVLHGKPSELQYDQANWSPALVQQYIKDHYGIQYSKQSCRRLMKKAGLQYQQSSNADENTEFRYTWIH